jgi:hypothetical protein
MAMNMAMGLLLQTQDRSEDFFLRMRTIRNIVGYIEPHVGAASLDLRMLRIRTIVKRAPPRRQPRAAQPARLQPAQIVA